MSTHKITSCTGIVLWTSDASSVRATLDEAVARGANLGGANLGGANLRGANLGGANLGGANLGGAYLGGANLIAAYRSDGHLFTAARYGDSVRLFAGCHTFTLAEAREFWTRTRGGTPLGDESQALVDHIERIARIRGWIGVVATEMQEPVLTQPLSVGPIGEEG